MAMVPAKFIRACDPITILSLRGDLQARAECDACGGHEDWRVVTRAPPEQVRKHFINEGWSLGRKLLCPNCIAAKQTLKPKDTPIMAQSNVTPIVPPPAEPTDAAKAQRRMVYMAIEDAYNESAKHYKTGNSDETIAKAIGCAPALVSKVREEFFSPSAIPVPPEVADLLKRIGDAHTRALNAGSLAQTAQLAVTESVAQVAALQAELDSLIKRNGWSA